MNFEKNLNNSSVIFISNTGVLKAKLIYSPQIKCTYVNINIWQSVSLTILPQIQILIEEIYKYFEQSLLRILEIRIRGINPGNMESRRSSRNWFGFHPLGKKAE